MGAEKARRYRTGEIARLTGVHPNTVRLYEQWGHLPPVPRDRRGRRLFGPRHLEQMRLARLAFPGPHPGGSRSLFDLVAAAARGRYKEARSHARLYGTRVKTKAEEAERAAALVDAWRAGSPGRDPGAETRTRRRAALHLGLSFDTLRHWERNGLIRIPRDGFGYCLYGRAETDWARIVRLLRDAGYSVAAIHRLRLRMDERAAEPSRDILDAADPLSEIRFVADTWLTTLEEHRRRAARILRQLDRMARLFSPV